MAAERKIADIKNEFANTSMEKWELLFQEYAEDERSGVKKLIAAYQRKIQAYEKERQRLEGMREFERKYGNDYSCICGIDEAGRGPLAGPVVAGAVVLPAGCDILYLNDSKKVSPKRREELYEEIREKAVAFGIGMSSPARIDEIKDRKSVV